MANKEVYIGDTKIGYANSAEVSPDITDAEETKTFDGPIIDTPESVGWEVSIDKIRYATTIADYKAVEILLLGMFKNKETVRIVEKTNLPDGELEVETTVFECVISDKKYSIDPESRTVENLTFKGNRMEHRINGDLVGSI